MKYSHSSTGFCVGWMVRWTDAKASTFPGNCWAKCCFELTDFGTHAAVSVVTKGDSDDANGCNLKGNTAWLQVCRVGNNFAFHYSVDGENFYMMRYFHLPVEPTVKVGLLAQAPTGNGGIRVYEHLTIEKKTVKNIRAGK